MRGSADRYIIFLIYLSLYYATYMKGSIFIDDVMYSVTAMCIYFSALSITFNMASRSLVRPSGVKSGGEHWN